MRAPMDDLECPHGMGKKASCVECMNDGPVTTLVKAKKKAETWIAARFDGFCADCDTHIQEGEQIGLVEGTGWCCGGCAE